MSKTNQPFEHDSFDGHENISYINDEASGLHAIIAIHSTALGPAAGGCRMLPYENTAEALYDVLRLSRGMTYKCAVANLPLGGGKSVIIGNPATEKTPELLRAFGRAVNRFNGTYWTAEDMNIGTDDVEIMALETPYAVGLHKNREVSGDPSPITAKGVFEGIKIALAHRTGSPSLDGVTVAVQGIGNVGYALCEMLYADGAKLIVTDTNDEVLGKAQRFLDAEIVALDEIYEAKADIFAPCAGGATLNPENISKLRANIVAGSANNQLETPACGAMLEERGILYAPDYVINAGGVIHVSGDILNISNEDWTISKLSELMQTLDDILKRAESTGVQTDIVADLVARERIANGLNENRIAV